MGDKEKFWEEVGKKLPVDKVYDDVLHPSFSEVGNALQGAVRVALAPISALVWVNITVRRSRQSGVARATCPD